MPASLLWCSRLRRHNKRHNGPGNHTNALVVIRQHTDSAPLHSENSLPHATHFGLSFTPMSAVLPEPGSPLSANHARDMIVPPVEQGPAHDDVVDLAAVARGDRPALGRLYDRHSPWLLALGVRMLSERREAEDILHDVFVEVWKHAGDYDPERATVKTWLVLRMRSRCLDRLRSAGHARREVDDRPRGRDDAPRRAQAGSAASGQLDERLDAHRLRGALTSLPEDQRAVIVLGFFDGLSSSEIADELGIPIGTVKSRVRSAMTKLRQALGVSES
ncbi:MAG: sigma-70 family RNA polymerase sigma factor [Myxococcota bacterium]